MIFWACLRLSMGFKNTGSHGGGGEGQEVKENYREERWI